MKAVFIISLFLLVAADSRPQSCFGPGQTPKTAIPLCSLDTIRQVQVIPCTDRVVPAGRCGYYSALNPYWYQFTCFQSGTFPFLIVPKYLVTAQNLGDDYNWALYDITGRAPNDVYADPSLFLEGNWSGTTGVTGVATNAVDSVECMSSPPMRISPYSIVPTLQQGHTYLLLVSHFTPNQSGYDLTFPTGKAKISTPPVHSFSKAFVACDAVTISIKIDFQIKCSSLAADGSDFSISAAGSKIIAASAQSCASGIDPDSVTLHLDQPLAPGTYTITARVGTDGNTLVDQCGNSVTAGDSISFTVPAPAPTNMDSLAPVGCSPHSLRLVFRNPIQCQSIAADGSDFSVTGPSKVIITSANGNCTTGASNEIVLQLASPITTAGSYHIQLLQGADGNTIIDACGQQTPAGASLDFAALSSVSASFNYQINYGCTFDSILFNNQPLNGANFWAWSYNGDSSGSPNPLFIDSSMGQKKVSLMVSNGVCSDTSSVAFSLDNRIRATLTGPTMICPNDQVSFNVSFSGTIASWNWDFSDGTSSDAQVPAPHQFPLNNRETVYAVRLIIGNGQGCYDSAYWPLTKLKSCYIAVPSGFTPNGDGINDYLYPLNAYRADDLIFKVFNRNGQLVFETRDWTVKWDGSFQGKKQPTGTYVWTLQYTDRETGKKIHVDGTTTLIR